MSAEHPDQIVQDQVTFDPNNPPVPSRSIISGPPIGESGGRMIAWIVTGDGKFLPANSDDWVALGKHKYWTAPKVGFHCQEAEPDPITPDEALEELDDREAAEIDPPDSSRPNNRTWAELDASTEADRRFLLDTVREVSAILATHAKPLDNESSGDTVWKLCRAPQGFEDEVGEFLKGVLKIGVQAIGRLDNHG